MYAAERVCPSPGVDRRWPIEPRGEEHEGQRDVPVKSKAGARHEHKARFAAIGARGAGPAEPECL